MRQIFVILLIPIFIFAKVKPYESVELKSSTNGLVSDAAMEDGGTFVS